MRSQQAAILTLGLCLATFVGALGVVLPARAQEHIHGHGDMAVPASSGDALSIQAQGQSLTFTVASLGRSGVTGAAKLTPLQGDKVAVEVTVDGVGAEARPIHIHQGACADLNPVPEIPLSPVMNGASMTVVDASLQQLMSTPHAIFLHKSTVELPVFVACADIMAAAEATALPSTGEGESYAAMAAGLFGIGCAFVVAGWYLWRQGHRAWASRAR